MISVSGCVLFDLCYVSGPISYRMQVTQPCPQGPVWRSMWIKGQLARLMSSELGHQFQATNEILPSLVVGCIYTFWLFSGFQIFFAPGSPMMKHICVTYFCLFIFNKCHVRLVLEIIYTHDHVEMVTRRRLVLFCALLVMTYRVLLLWLCPWSLECSAWQSLLELDIYSQNLEFRILNHICTPLRGGGNLFLRLGHTWCIFMKHQC